MSRLSADVLRARKAAVAEAVKEVKGGMVIGLGSGSTMKLFIERLGGLVKKAKLGVKAVPTSYQSKFLAIRNGITLTTLDENPILDLAIDGADQVDKNRDAIKGGGGALTREKIVASAAREVAFVIDEKKLVQVLDLPVPVEVLPFSLGYVKRAVREIGGELKLRGGQGKLGPLVSDNGGVIADVELGAIEKPDERERQLRGIPGIIENGLFVGVAQKVYVGRKDGSIKRL